MKLRVCMLALALAPVLVASAASPRQSTSAPSAPYHATTGIPSHSLAITGAVKASVELNLADLKQLAPRDTGPMDVVCASGEVKGRVNNFRGVLLTDVLNAVGIDLQSHKDDRRMVIVARATDGYTVTFSWSELYNTEIGKQVLVAWEKDGKPLDDGEGQFLLISGKDIKTGPRHVRNLSSIEVVRMQ